MSMQAIHVSESGSTSQVLSLTTVPTPKVEAEHDILVRVRGVALNPIDTAMRKHKLNGILGYDGAGEVVAVGPQAQARGFKEGDRVLYAGDITRTGSNAQYQLVDSRIVGRLPAGLKDWAEAAALPLVSLTAWEMFEDHFGLRAGEEKNARETLLIVNGAGGVGTAAIQLARKVFGIKTIIATASRPETVEWVKKLGATHVIDHRKELGPQLKELDLVPSLAFDCHDAATYVPALVPLMGPFGRIGSITNQPYTLSEELARVAFTHALGIHYEFMFARAMWKHDMARQGEILDRVAELTARGELVAGVTRREPFGVKALREGHDLQESGKSYGKIAFELPENLDEE